MIKQTRRTSWSLCGIWWCGLAALLNGCTVGPNFTAPNVDAPAAWHTDNTSQNVVGERGADAGMQEPPITSQTYGGTIDTAWWQRFGDPELDSLIARLAKQNLDVHAAAERIAQAMSQRQVVRSQGLPKLDAQASYQRQRVSKDGVASLEEPAPGAPLEYNLYQDGLSASWELDLFGRVRRGVEAANANIDSVVEARRGIALSVLSQLARNYMQLRGVQKEEAIAVRNVQLADKNIELVQSQYANGVATALALSQARSQRATVAAALPSLDNLQAQLINAIGALLALPPQALSSELRADAAPILIPPRVPVGLPSTLARQRPDIREAEDKLHEATAATGVAVASFYPDVTLMGDFNLNGLMFADAFRLPDRAFSVGPSIDIPIFQGGRLKGTLHLRQAQQREAAIAYRKAVLRGWQEVDDAMTAYREIQHARGNLEEARKQDQFALETARQQYALGSVDFLNVTAAQKSVLDTERALADNETQTENALVSLYVALGGGWELAETGAADVRGAGY